METLSTILQQFGKAGNIAALFSSVLGVFVFIENMSSPQARADFTKYLKSTDYPGSVVHLPEDTRGLFERVFGSRHFSLRCVVASILFSITAVVGLFALAILNNLNAYLGWARDFWQQDPILNAMIGAWIVWSIVPDYFNLLKTRTVLNMVAARQIKRTSVLVCILVADFAIGYIIFSLTFFPILVASGIIGLGIRDAGLSGALKLMPFIALDFFSNPSAYVALDLLNPFSSETPLSGELSPLFWASMVPSIWLWLYVAATLIVRLAVRTAPVFRFSMYLFDIEQHPIRSVGVVAATLVSGGYAVVVAISKFAQVLSEAA